MVILKIPGKYLLLFILTVSFVALYCSNRPSIDKPGRDINPDTGEIVMFPDKIDSDAVSKGETVLIHQIPWLNEQESDSNLVKERKLSCKQYWQLKVDSEFDEFLQKCPIDIESKIHSNNKKARERAESTNNIIVNIAIVVPIGGERDKIPNPEGKKINGVRVFDSIEILKGIEIAQRENSNGIQFGDKKVFLEVSIVDDSYVDNISDKQKAQESANYLVDNQDTVAVIGHFSSDSIQAAAIIYNDKIVAISPTSTAIRTDNKPTSSADKSDKLKLNSYIFRTSPNDTIAIKTLVGIVKNENKKNNTSLKTAMILYEENNSFSKLYKQYFKNQFEETIKNGQIVEDTVCRFYDNHANNQKKYCIDAIAKNQPDLLLLVPSSKRALELAGTVLKRINDLDTKPQLLGADSMFDTFFLSEFAEGMIVAVPVKTKELNNIQLSWRGAMTYDATKAIAKGIQNSQCDIDLNDNNSNNKINQCLRQQIQKALSNDNFKAHGIVGKNTVFFDKNGDRQVDESLQSELEAPLQIKKSETGQYNFELR